jgi:DNA-binding transcriptional ArsR family regulator
MINNQQQLNDVFHALSNEIRREIVAMLSTKPHGFGEIVERFDVSKAAISKHVKVLEQVSIVEREVKGRNHTCRLNAEAMQQAHAWLDAYEKFWSARLDKLKRVLERRRKIDGKR